MNKSVFTAVALLSVAVAPLAAQTFATEDPILRAIWAEGMEHSHTYVLSQVLSDSIGPRLTGSPGHEAGNRWLVNMYRSWNIDARTEEYGEWMNWQRGRTHVDLVEPRVRTLESILLAWSPGTNGRTVRGDVVVLPTVPAVANDVQFAEWLPSVRGKFVAVSMPQPTCRPDSDWEEFATPATLQRMQDNRRQAAEAWAAMIDRTGYTANSIIGALEGAGAAGIISSRWSNGWGVQKIFSASTEEIPQIDVSCEDYGLLFRLAENNQRPVIEVMAEGEFQGVDGVANVIAMIRGTELPDEYVMLSAHFDSWDGGSGTTDNGTGTVTMLEAMRILREVYPNPRRTILVGHWGGEEQGLIGSSRYAAHHPEIVANIQALFNQDNGTGRVVNISGQGFTHAAEYFGRWLTRVPGEITGNIDVNFPGMPSGGGTDHASFVCYGAPAFGLGSLNWNYFTYTWHTNRDTFDKISFDDLKNNATLTAMLAYLASEEDETLPRDRRTVFPTNRRTGEPTSWPDCRQETTWEAYHNRMTGNQ